MIFPVVYQIHTSASPRYQPLVTHCPPLSINTITAQLIPSVENGHHSSVEVGWDYISNMMSILIDTKASIIPTHLHNDYSKSNYSDRTCSCYSAHSYYKHDRARKNTGKQDILSHNKGHSRQHLPPENSL